MVSHLGRGLDIPTVLYLGVEDDYQAGLEELLGIVGQAVEKPVRMFDLDLVAVFGKLVHLNFTDLSRNERTYGFSVQEGVPTQDVRVLSKYEPREFTLTQDQTLRFHLGQTDGMTKEARQQRAEYLTDILSTYDVPHPIAVAVPTRKVENGCVLEVRCDPLVAIEQLDGVRNATMQRVRLKS